MNYNMDLEQNILQLMPYSYLHKRKQSIIINGYESEIQILNHIQLGSVLGPLLFLIYINDLRLSIQNSNVYHFADEN